MRVLPMTLRLRLRDWWAATLNVIPLAVFDPVRRGYVGAPEGSLRRKVLRLLLAALRYRRPDRALRFISPADNPNLRLVNTRSIIVQRVFWFGERGYEGPAEAQVAALADDIAYDNHDIDDGLRAGLFTVAELGPLPLVGPVFREVAERYPGIEDARLIHESVRRLIDRMVNDLLAETRRRLAEAGPESATALRALDAPVVAFSAPMRQNDAALKDFLFRHMYRHERVNRMTARARAVVRDLFALYMEAPDHLPEEWRAEARDAEPAEIARLVADYIAGMTDRFALEEHRKLFGSDGKL